MERKILETIQDDSVLLEVKLILLSLTDEAYIVGGAVRDIIYLKDPKDFDFVVGKVGYTELTKAFTYAGWDVQENGAKFLVLMITKIINQVRYNFEITLFRKDGTYVDGRRPETVEIGTIKDDALRRDFSINSLYFNLKTLKLEDPTRKGLEDIRTRTLRFNGRAKDRLEEDFLRLYRAIRFIKKYNLSFARGSERVFNKMFIENCHKVNPQRILNELNKI